MTRADRKMVFAFSLTYFKPSGKFYTETDYEYECACIGDTDQPYLYDAVAHVRGLRDGDGQGVLPGLSDTTSGWDGFILVRHADGVPHLIVPANGELK